MIWRDVRRETVAWKELYATRAVVTGHLTGLKTKDKIIIDFPTKPHRRSIWEYKGMIEKDEYYDDVLN